MALSLSPALQSGKASVGDVLGAASTDLITTTIAGLTFTGLRYAFTGAASAGSGTITPHALKETRTTSVPATIVASGAASNRLTDPDGAYLTDPDGAYLTEPN